MRGVFGLISLIFTLVIIGLVAKQQLSAMHANTVEPGASGAPSVGQPANLPQQVQADLDRAAQDAAKRLQQAEDSATKP